jgi:hypothetical protein
MVAMTMTLQRDNVAMRGIVRRDRLTMKMDMLVGNFHSMKVSKLL